MKAFLLPLVACAALAGCADYGTAAYGSYPTYPYGAAAYAAPGYPYGAYPYDTYGYGYGWADPAWAYGFPAVGLTINEGRFRGHRGGHGGDGHWNDRDGRAHGGDHRDMSAGMAPGAPATSTLGAGPAFPRRGAGRGRHMAGHGGGPRPGADGAQHHR